MENKEMEYCSITLECVEDILQARESPLLNSEGKLVGESYYLLLEEIMEGMQELLSDCYIRAENKINKGTEPRFFEKIW